MTERVNPDVAPAPDTTNRFLLGVTVGGKIGPLKPIRWPLDSDDALNLAAWLVAMTAEHERFDKLLLAVLES